jgi:hypothetical protein
MEILLHKYDKFVAIHNKYSKISPSTSVHFATRVRRSRVVSSELLFTFVYAGGSRFRDASQQFVSCIQRSFVNFALCPTPTNPTERRKE